MATACIAPETRFSLGAAALVLGLAACAMHRTVPAATDARTSITETEIDSVHALNAYDAVRRLRPQFLSYRGAVSLDPRQPPALPNVYMDNVLYGDVSTLRNISAATIESITFYNSSEAQYTFGRGNAAGVISIVTKH
jgi:hypothetical protein